MVRNLPCVIRDRDSTTLDRRLRSDLRTLATFVSVYCRDHHTDQSDRPFALKSPDLSAMLGKELLLCPTCAKLLAHACVKRMHCPMDPKPACKHCPQHCYNPAYREQIQRIMQYSGRKLLFSGRIDYLVRMLF
ncbi:MAG: nitrous oxide-stimulated promoter family protein [Phycisphaerae bacterium]